ncbi:hypothetical protein [Desulfatitalea alkaliphila]|uniref:Uncharacterized protein n=1 Tax=Desulfatitalea alkaliphila TaxID=2929485 RepID=A0AA41QZ44_9BACT|nr:hypothetical protein [Desulfatitalea alkaliphila]MCJ8499727.1 hypothetical protein [Desulfatitalea alkaliphila]
MKINAWLIFGIIGVSVFGSQFVIHYYRAVWGNAEMWWTPKTMALSIDDTRNYVELYLNDELLQDHIKRGSLSVTGRNGQSMLVGADDIKARLNNWHKMKASFLHTAVYMALLLGASLMSIATGIVQILAGANLSPGTVRSL